VIYTTQFERSIITLFASIGKKEFRQLKFSMQIGYGSIWYEVWSTGHKFTQTYTTLRRSQLSFLLLKDHNYKSDLSVYIYLVVDNTVLLRVQHGEKLVCAVADSS